MTDRAYDYRGCRSSDGPMPPATCIVFKLAAPQQHVAICPCQLDAILVVDALNASYREAKRRSKVPQ